MPSIRPAVINASFVLALTACGDPARGSAGSSDTQGETETETTGADRVPLRSK